MLDHLLRIAYLQHANVLDSKPSSKNAKWVELARNGVDIEALHTYVLTYPDMGPGIPLLTNFLGLQIDQNALDLYGATELCRAVQAFDVGRVKTALKASADPNGKCGGADVLWIAAMSPETRFISERQQMVLLLLEHGATRNYVAQCEERNLGDCKTGILPILKQFAAKKL